MVIIAVTIANITNKVFFAGKTNKDPKEKWGYVDVRPGAHMFWWLYYTSHSSGYSNRPLIIWLQVFTLLTAQVIMVSWSYTDDTDLLADVSDICLIALFI